MNEHGYFIVSLDFELFWGVRDKRTIETYGNSISNVKQVVPRLLELFEEYDISATFATVGLLFAKDRTEMETYSPQRKPNYLDKNLSPYQDGFDLVGENGNEDPYHYALDLIKLIQGKTGKHEISTHTYSHYYCLEQGQTKDDFEDDIKAAVAIAQKEGITIESIVFPRNQFNKDYADVLLNNGIKSYRGNERVWFQSYQNEEDTSFLKKVFRTANCYLNLSGHHTYKLKELGKNDLPLDIPSSRFLRPYQAKYPFLKPLQLRRIKKSMTHAAKKGQLYHLWWHPHNFGANMDENFKMLEDILMHQQYLRLKYGFRSSTMKEIAHKLEVVKRAI